MSAQILGVVLSFASVDGQELALTVSLSEPSAAVLEWGDKTQTSEESARILTFRGLPVPVREPVRYELRVPGLAPLIETVEPPVLDGKVRAALYGDNRDGPGPHAIIVAQMARAHPSVIVHTGDVVRMMEDEEGWDSYLATTFPLARRVPTILALGNHELSSMRQHSSVARTKILSHVPTAFDAIASELETPRGVFHVRVGPAVFISLDSNSDFGPGSPQLAFVDRVLTEKGDATLSFIAMHHGPLSAGPHGGHPSGGALLEMMKKHHVTAVLSGHDHVYQRTVDDGIVSIVSGGGGAPLYTRERPMEGVEAFSSTYNWVQMDLEGPAAKISAFALEGTLLDQAVIAPVPESRPHHGVTASWLALLAGQLLVLIALARIVVRWGGAVR